MRTQAGKWLALAIICCFFLVPFVAQDKSGELRIEEAEDYFSRWLDQDVVYIITQEERAIFEKLTTPDEKEQFIEQFWLRRDADPSTGVNEFKDEHYRRIAYANEHFASGLEGWATDRGKIFIIHGEPAEIESHPAGGQYRRAMGEGGGQTATYPFEVWRYRHIEGIGDDVILEFVDRTMSGEYRLALFPEEKDALLHVPGAGKTLAEQMGLASKQDRAWFSPGSRQNYSFANESVRDSPFARYERYALVQRPSAPKYNDLKELVTVGVDYTALPAAVRVDYFRLNDDQVLVPVTLQIDNRDMTFGLENGLYVARIAVYGVITSITNRVVTEFEEDLIVSYRPEELENGRQLRSMYQRILPLDRKLRYKLDLVVKDLNSGHVGVAQKAILPPVFRSEQLCASSLILSSGFRILENLPIENEGFVLGDLKIFPSLTKEFNPRTPLVIYLHVYNAKLDQTSLSPSLTVAYKLLQGGKLLMQALDEDGESTHFFSDQRVVLLKARGLDNLEPGNYELQVDVKDRLSDQRITVAEEFRIVKGG